MEGGHCLLERMLNDKNAEPTGIPMSLLKSITNNFSDDQKIGCGGFAVVYKGHLENGAVIAVKKLSNSIGVDENKYNEQVSCLMRVKHRNIVRFLGYCADTQGKMSDYEGKFVMADVRERLLCFEFVPNGTLKDHIKDASIGLDWRKRYQIIKGICEGLHYLHQKDIVHLDLNPANILLDGNMVPKIADFGISRCFDQEQSLATALKVVRTLGYLAPESSTGKITPKLDIYSLGVIITEILTGQKGYSSVENVLRNWRNRLETSSATETILEQIRVCSEISIDCMETNPEKRPITQRIIDLLEKTECMDEFKETDLQTTLMLERPLEHRVLPRRRRSSSATFGVTVKADHIREAPLAATTISVLLEVTGAPSSTIEGAGLDLVVVLDVSDSMRGIKLDQLKLGMQFVIKKLRPSRDRLCIVTFTTQAARLSPLRVMSEAAKSEFELIVSGLAVGGRGTSIWAGLMEGLAVLGHRRQTDGRSANILLMSDGQRTYGPDARSIVDSPCDLSVYTLAFGADADAQALQEVADRHGGTFNAVPESGGMSMVVAIFSQLIAGLQTVVVQNLKLILTKPSSSDVDLDKIVKVAPGGGYGYATEIDRRRGTITVTLRDLFSGEVRKVVVDLLLIESPDRDYESDILDVKVVYDNVQLGMTETFRIPTLYIARTTSATGGMTTCKLQAELARRQHADYIKTARLLADGENLQDARHKLAEARNALEGFAPDHPMVGILRTELRQLLDRMESQELYNKEGRPYALAAESSHVRQRFASRGDVDGVRLFATPRMDTDLQQAKRFAEKPGTPLPVVDGTPLPITDEENLKERKSHKWIMAGLGG